MSRRHYSFLVALAIVALLPSPPPNAAAAALARFLASRQLSDAPLTLDCVSSPPASPAVVENLTPHLAFHRSADRSSLMHVRGKTHSPATNP